jgi:hypothetical protein
VATDDQCSACGERNPPGSAFCVFCGTYLGWNEPASGTGPESSASTRPTVAQEAAGTESATVATPRPAPPPLVEAVAGTPCPRCGQPNTAERRFCSRCGYTLVAAQTGLTQRRPPPRRVGWWARLTHPEERRARREYRRSLPAFYRWRRVIVTVGLVVVVAVVLALTGNNPVGYVRNWWRDHTGDLQAIGNVTATAAPPHSVAPSYDVADLVHPRKGVWATAWPVHRLAPMSCGTTAAQAGRIVLSWNHPRRVRRLDVWAGLAGDGRMNQSRPKKLDVGYGADGCTRLSLLDTADRQLLPFDSGTAVKRLVISVGAVYGPEATPPQPLVASGGIQVLYRPD